MIYRKLRIYGTKLIVLHCQKANTQWTYAGCDIYLNIFIFNGNSVTSDQLNMNCRMYGKHPGMKIPTRLDMY